MSPLALPFARAPAPLVVEPVVRRALEEDFGRGGDLTSDLLVPSDQLGRAQIVAREPGTLCGLVCADCAFRFLDASMQLEPVAADGAAVSAGQTIAALDGRTRALLGAERVALNFIGHLSGIATATRELVDAVTGSRARIVCTRKTTPGLRALEKYAVRCGGGFNHRFGLDDAVLIKDNHIVAAGGLRHAVERARRGLGHMVMIEVEVDTLAQLEEALSLGIGSVLLDNMSPDDLKRAADLARGRALLEASGRITAATVRAVADAGVDFISAGAITHSARSLDVGLDF